MTDLPHGWEWATLEDLAGPMARAITDGPFGSNLKSEHYTESGARVIRLQNIGDGRFRDERTYISLARFEALRTHEVRPGDLVIASLGDTPPRACLVPTLTDPAIVKADCIRVRLSSHVDSRWVLHTLTSPQAKKFAANLIRGVGRPRLGLSQIRALRVPVPPFAEQRRIVAALESHLSRSDAGISEGDAARRRVAQLWESILNREISGQSHGERWPIASLGELSYDSSYGTSVKCAYNGQGAPVVRIPNIADGRVDPTDMKYATDPAVDLSSLYLTNGDILLVRTNGSRSLIGRTAVVGELGTNTAFASYLIRFRLRAEIVRPRWIHHVLEGLTWRRKLEREAASSAGQYNLSLAKLERIDIPCPGLSEQDSILSALDDQRFANNRLESSLEVAIARGDVLRRSLLSAAFAGRLVPQDPDDEPASVLLERIKSKRAVQPTPKLGRRSTKKTNQDQESML